MDQRQTFDNTRHLFSFVLSLFQQKQKASILIDKEGLVRVEGWITDIKKHDDIGETKIIIDTGDTISLNQVIAINGLFRSDYSEC